MDSVPRDINFMVVKSDILKISGVMEVNDLHIWQTGTENRLLSARLKTKELDSLERMELMTKIQELLAKKHRIKHITLQVMSAKEAEKLTFNHCN